MSLSENTLNNLFRKKIGITLHFSSDYSLENNEINFNFSEFLEFVDQNIVFGLSLILNMVLLIFLYSGKI